MFAALGTHIKYKINPIEAIISISPLLSYVELVVEIISIAQY